MDDRELLDALRSGDEDAFNRVFDRVRGRIFGYLVRMCAHRQQAEDLLQETFTTLARKASELPDGVRLEPWLFTVARNLFIDHRRRARLDFERLNDLALWPSRPVRVEETPLDLSQANDLARRLEAALAALPEKYREAVVLVSIEGLEPREAARVVGVDDATLRQRLSRGRKMLRETWS